MKSTLHRIRVGYHSLPHLLALQKMMNIPTQTLNKLQTNTAHPLTSSVLPNAPLSFNLSANEDVSIRLIRLSVLQRERMTKDRHQMFAGEEALQSGPLQVAREEWLAWGELRD
jgi:hypothetical protein